MTVAHSFEMALDTRELGALGGSVAYPAGGGSTAWTVAADLYPSYWELAAAIATAVKAATSDAAWTCVWSPTDHTIALARGGVAFDADLHPVLQAHCGWSDSYSAVTSAAGDAPRAFCPTDAMVKWDVQYEHDRHWDEGDEDIEPIVVLRGTQAVFVGQVWVPSDSLLGDGKVFWQALIRGEQFRLHIDPADLTVWSETNRTGYFDLRQRADEYGAEWVFEQLATDGELSLEAIVVEQA